MSSALQALVAKWRELVALNEFSTAGRPREASRDAYEQCAAELEAALASPPVDAQVVACVRAYEWETFFELDEAKCIAPRYAKPGDMLLYSAPSAQVAGHSVTLNAVPWNDDVREILGYPNFHCGPIAHVFQAAGRDIKKRSEDEQAFVLHWLLNLTLKHGDGWRKIASEELAAAHAEAALRAPTHLPLQQKESGT